MVSGVVFGCACEDVFFLFHTFSYCFSKLPLVSNQCITIWRDACPCIIKSRTVSPCILFSTFQESHFSLSQFGLVNRLWEWVVQPWSFLTFFFFAKALKLDNLGRAWHQRFQVDLTSQIRKCWSTTARPRLTRPQMNIRYLLVISYYLFAI